MDLEGIDDSFSAVAAPDVRERPSDVAVLPVGSFEQHGDFLPLVTDTLIARIVAARISAEHGLMLLSPVTFGCSHEHAQLGATVSIRARTLYDLVMDIAESVRGLGVPRLVVVNAHGGNYVLANIVQEANERERRMALFPARPDWDAARKAAGLETSGTEDMHAGELETSILLYAAPEFVRPGFESSDHDAPSRPLLATVGMRGYTTSGVIGRPSLASAAKGEAVLDALSGSFIRHLTALRGGIRDGEAGIIRDIRKSTAQLRGIRLQNQLRYRISRSS